jgi:hypothetical protein
MNDNTLADLETAFARCRADEYTCFVSFYGDKIGVSISRRTSTKNPGLSIDVKSEAYTVSEAFAKAFANFPTNPLDGASEWHSARLAASEGQFTEVDK